MSASYAAVALAGLLGSLVVAIVLFVLARRRPRSGMWWLFVAELRHLTRAVSGGRGYAR